MAEADDSCPGPITDPGTGSSGVAGDRVDAGGPVGRARVGVVEREQAVHLGDGRGGHGARGPEPREERLVRGGGDAVAADQVDVDVGGGAEGGGEAAEHGVGEVRSHDDDDRNGESRSKSQI